MERPTPSRDLFCLSITVHYSSTVQLFSERLVQNSVWIRSVQNSLPRWQHFNGFFSSSSVVYSMLQSFYQTVQYSRYVTKNSISWDRIAKSHALRTVYKNKFWIKCIFKVLIQDNKSIERKHIPSTSLLQFNLMRFSTRNRRERFGIYRSRNFLNPATRQGALVKQSYSTQSKSLSPTSPTTPTPLRRTPSTQYRTAARRSSHSSEYS